MRCNLKMELAVDWVSLSVDQLKCVRAVAVHESIAIGSASVAEQERDLMRSFWTQRDKVPKHVGVFQMSDRISFLGVNKRRELLKLKKLGVKSDQQVKIPKLLKIITKMGSRIKKIGVLLPTISQIPCSVQNLRAKPRGSRAVSAEPDSPPTVENRRAYLNKNQILSLFLKTNNEGLNLTYHWSSFTDLVENDRLGILGNVMSNFEITKCSGTFRMHNSFGHSLAIKMSHFINVDGVLNQKRSSLSSSHRVKTIADGRTMASRENFW